MADVFSIFFMQIERIRCVSVQPDMKWLLFLLWLITVNAKAQSTESGSQHPAQLLAAVDATLPSTNPSATAAFQALNWKNKVKENPSNAENWLNYYLWTTRRTEISQRQKKETLDEIMEESRAYIFEKAAYQLMLFLQSDKNDTVSINKAIAMAKEEVWIMPFAVQYFILSNNWVELNKYCAMLERAKPISAELYQYNYNTLMSADSNSIIYARGLYDLVPIAILQQVYGIRKDIKLMYYDGKIVDQKNIYLCLSLGKEIIAQYPNASCTGLLAKLTNVSTFNELKRHIENDFRISKIQEINNLTKDIAHLYKNYIPSLAMLYKYYQSTDKKRADEIKSIILKISMATKSQEQINRLLKNTP